MKHPETIRYRLVTTVFFRFRTDNFPHSPKAFTDKLRMSVYFNYISFNFRAVSSQLSKIGVKVSNLCFISQRATWENSESLVASCFHDEDVWRKKIFYSWTSTKNLNFQILLGRYGYKQINHEWKISQHRSRLFTGIWSFKTTQTSLIRLYKFIWTSLNVIT